MANTMMKWAAATAASGILAFAVAPAIAAHVTHKHLAATGKTARPLVATSTGAAKPHALHVTASHEKPKVAVAKKVKHLTRAHAKAAVKTAVKHKTVSLDKSSHIKSNM